MAIIHLKFIHWNALALGRALGSLHPAPTIREALIPPFLILILDCTLNRCYSTTAENAQHEPAIYL
jgi:hypothetical protein